MELHTAMRALCIMVQGWVLYIFLSFGQKIIVTLLWSIISPCSMKQALVILQKSATKLRYWVSDKLVWLKIMVSFFGLSKESYMPIRLYKWFSSLNRLTTGSKLCTLLSWGGNSKLLLCDWYIILILVYLSASVWTVKPNTYYSGAAIASDCTPSL